MRENMKTPKRRALESVALIGVGFVSALTFIFLTGHYLGLDGLVVMTLVGMIVTVSRILYCHYLDVYEKADVMQKLQELEDKLDTELKGL
jgi:hypothetical protein